MKPSSRLLITLTMVAAIGLQARAQSNNAKNQPRSLDSLRAAVAKNPKDTESLIALGKAYLQLGRPDSAVLSGQKVLAIDEKNVQAYALVSRSQLIQKDTVGALRTINEGLQLMRGNQELLILLGSTYLAVDSSNRAIVTFSLANEAGAPKAEAYAGLGQAYLRQSATPVAISYFEKAVALDSLNVGYRSQLASLYLKNRRYNDAARELRAVLAFDSTNHMARFELGKLYWAAKQWANAARVWTPYLRLYPDSADAWPYAMESFLNSRDYDQALSTANLELKRNPGSVKARRAAAQAQFELRRYDKAITAYQKLSQVDSLTGEDLRRFGLSYAQTKRDSLATFYLEAAIRTDSSQRDLYNELGVLYMQNRRYADAARMFERRYQIEPNATSAYINYALSNMQLGRFDLARAALLQAISLKPDFAPSHLALARCLVRMDSVSASRAYYENFLKQNENSSEKNKVDYAEAYSMIGVNSLLEKKYPQAIEYFQKSLKFREDNFQVHLWLGQAYALSNKRQEAIQAYKRVLKLDPGNKDAKKGLEFLGEYLD